MSSIAFYGLGLLINDPKVAFARLDKFFWTSSLVFILAMFSTLAFSGAPLTQQIWGYFGDELAQPSQSSSLTGTIPKSLCCFGQEYVVRSWRDVVETTLNTIADLEPDYFKEIMQQFPRFIGWDEKDFRSTRQLRNGAFIEVNLSAQDIYTFCMKAIETAELSIEEWSVETQDSNKGIVQQPLV